MEPRPTKREATLTVGAFVLLGVVIACILLVGGCAAKAPETLVFHLQEENARLTSALRAAEPIEEVEDPVVVAAERVAVAVEGNTEAIRDGLDQDASFYDRVLGIAAPGGGGVALTVLGLLGYRQIQKRKNGHSDA